jgi:hypothetical protein
MSRGPAADRPNSIPSGNVGDFEINPAPCGGPTDYYYFLVTMHVAVTTVRAVEVACASAERWPAPRDGPEGGLPCPRRIMRECRGAQAVPNITGS